MTKLTDSGAVGFAACSTSKEQSEAFRRAWIANKEVKLLEGKTKSMTQD